MRGLSAGLAVALGVPLSEVWERLPNHVLQIIRSGVADGEFARAYGVAKDRYFWLEED
jgi:putative effector of murein hydrolase